MRYLAGCIFDADNDISYDTPVKRILGLAARLSAWARPVAWRLRLGRMMGFVGAAAGMVLRRQMLTRRLGMPDAMILRLVAHEFGRDLQRVPKASSMAAKIMSRLCQSSAVLN